MELYIKNFIIFFLIAIFAGMFLFHWFFISEMMPVTECFSINCVYSSPQAIPPESKNILLVVLLAVLFTVILSPLFLLYNKFKKTSNDIWVFKERIDVFDYKLTSWLKILEKRDPSRNIYGAGF